VYNKKDFLAGVAIGRQLKGWATGGTGGQPVPAADWSGPYMLTPINCDPSYPNKAMYFTRGEDYYFYVDMKLNLSVSAYTGVLLTAETSIFQEGVGAAFSWVPRNATYPGSFYLDNTGLQLAARNGSANKPYIVGSGIYPTRYGGELQTLDSNEYWCNYYETDTAVLIQFWMRPKDITFFDKPLFRLPEPLVPVNGFVSRDNSNTPVAVSVDHDGFFVVHGMSTNPSRNILFGGLSYEKRANAHKAACYFGDLSRWTWLGGTGATADITFNLDEQRCTARMYLGTYFDRFYVEHRLQAMNAFYILSFDITMPDGVPEITYGDTDDYIAIMSRAPSDTIYEFNWYREKGYVIAYTGYAYACMDRQKHHFELGFMAQDTQNVYLCIDMGYIHDETPFSFIIENIKFRQRDWGGLSSYILVVVALLLIFRKKGRC